MKKDVRAKNKRKKVKRGPEIKCMTKCRGFRVTFTFLLFTAIIHSQQLDMALGSLQN